ncbi:protein MpAP2L3 [Marchantia polymorpha subsp. ruderalis]|uniref:AP2/ERF domain-containing protein n=2 Tax=Marchantia polymorpha TaxID=3197 RepID=A0AAF6BGW2_MARPO|nr:hypothetical protein MARPO_0048s0045 [Marchantia polymorpha]BBN11246.1 hypothetical protein Mp_5g10280 [Marchantia polymorpha subsp. ruderalis]|eukprot:PTQ38925.1 hypothetical protein MARPO_0048s0045 [Marchantia polymorpha]
MAPFCAPCTTSAAAARCAALQFGVGGLVQSSSCCGGSNVADFRVREGRDGKPRDAMLCSRSAGIYELGGFGRLSLRDGDEFVRTLAAAGTGGVWFRKKRRWKAANSSSANVICEVSGGIGTETEVFESRVLNVSVSVSSSSSSSPSGSADAASSNQVVASESIFLSSTEKREEDTRGTPESVLKDSSNIESDKSQGGTKYFGVQPVRGRFEVELQKDGVVHKLIFLSQEEAARSYDKAAFKLSGRSARLNFDLTEEEKLEIQGTGWEDLLLKMQLQALSENSPAGLGFPGVQFKEDEQLWQAKIRHDKENYVGYFTTMNDATKAYDLAAYKLHGSHALLSQPLTASEKKELATMDWDALVVRLGLEIQARRIRRNSGCRGVRLTTSGGWHASFTYKSYYFYLGTFKTKETAAKAYDLFASKLIGERAKVNTELNPEELAFLSTHSVNSLREYLAGQAMLAPKQAFLGARGARMVQGRWEVCLENARKDRIFTSSVSSEVEALRVHDLAAYKLHNELAKTYQELSQVERQEVEAADWSSVAAKLDLQQLPSYHGVNRLISGMWQSYIRHGGAYLAVGTYDSSEVAARASDMCTYKLEGRNAILNFPLTELQRREVEAMDWGKLILSLREMQIKSDVDEELGDPKSLAMEDVSREKKWTILLCHEQLLQQRMMRRAPKVGRQLVVGNPSIAAQFSHLNRRPDGSPMLVEEVMDGSNTPLLWNCICGNLFLKAPVGLLKAKHATCRIAGCRKK